MSRLLRTRRGHSAGADTAITEDTADTANPADPADEAAAPEPRDESGAPDAPETADEAEDAENAADTDDPADTDDTAEAPAAPARRSRRALLRRSALAALALVLVLAGGAFFYGAHHLRSAPSARNTALTDNEATTRVAGDIGNDLARVFSYSPDGLDATERSARSVLTGKAARQYTELVGRIRADVAKQRVTLSTQAVRVAVVELHGGSATLLVFLDQVSRRDKGKATAAAAQLVVTAQKEGDQWRIVDMQTR
ncbi:hypothetical protein [Streptomyces sp. PsTaAH-124]|uniref:hypothetical protein n=1 Tax=Streptomyces sp. PsTaAH-124 TaxID=1157638 RepID=UPI00036048C0|nr:hypothetical protein [Streptomyces sp. PsTaAH-124]